MKLLKYIHRYWNQSLFNMRLFRIRWKNCNAYIEAGIKAKCDQIPAIGRGSSIRMFTTIIVKEAEGNDPTHILIFKLGVVIATIGCVLGQGLMLRYMMILNPFYIAAVVRACTLSHNKNLNAMVLVCVSFVSVYSFYHYLQADYCVSFLTYQSVFSAPFIP